MVQKEIISITEIQQLVDAFYEKVRGDELLGSVFNRVIEDRWPEHLEKMYRFWQTVLLDEHTYYGSPFSPHARLPIDAEHFERWLHLFGETVNENFTGKKATEAIWRAEKMAKMFQFKIDYFRNNPHKKAL